MQINSKVKNTKTKKPQKPTSQNNVKYIPSICITLNLFHNIFSSEIVCNDDFTSETSTFTWEVTGGNSVFLSWYLHFAAKDSKDINLYRFHMLNFFTFLTTFGHSFCLHYQIQGNSEKLSHIFWRILDALLMHFWCTFDALLMHFSFFYILLILQKSTKNTQNLLDQ